MSEERRKISDLLIKMHAKRQMSERRRKKINTLIEAITKKEVSEGVEMKEREDRRVKKIVKLDHNGKRRNGFDRFDFDEMRSDGVEVSMQRYPARQKSTFIFNYFFNYLIILPLNLLYHFYFPSFFFLFCNMEKKRKKKRG